MSGTIYVYASGGSFLASIAEVPGCVARGATRDEAVASVRRSFRDYLELMRGRGVSTEHWNALDPDTFAVKDPPEDRLVPEDTKPLEEHEIRDFLHQVEGSRSALLALVRGLSADDLERKPTPDMWSVREALEHVMQTEVTLLSRMEKWPDHDFATLQAAHRMAFQRFSILEPADTAGSHRIFQYGWSTRKVMRRILEHEYEHLQHIKQILAALGGQRAPE
ncbi:MAG: DinB family protein [Chloroflexi bacterium]|nr:DinB family protein [Chloroflexota bacterium]